MNNTQLNELLNKVKSVCDAVEKDREARLSRGECYNVFKVLGLFSEEVACHSPFIAELLNPKGSHGLGDKSLKAFLKQANISEDYINKENFNPKDNLERDIGKINADKTEGGRIDIIIEDGCHALIIENKIYAEERENQLLRYSNYAKKKFNGGFEMIYLTLYGEETIKYLINKGEGCRCMSYKEDIIAWLTECVNIAQDRPSVRETINQYIRLIKQLTNITMEKKYVSEVAKLAINSLDSTAAIFEAREQINKNLREQYIVKPLQEYVKTKDLCLKILDESSNHSIQFSRQGWKDFISVEANSNSQWKRMFIGIYSENETKCKLECLKSCAKPKWPYGWEYICPDDWESYGSYRDIKNGNVAKWIEKKVDEILCEITSRNIDI